MSSHIVSVGALARYLRTLIESNDAIADAWVEGEVSAYTHHRSGHAYFTIKDVDSSIDCVMWRTSVVRQSFTPRVGDQIVVHGGVTVYEKSTRLQLRADVVSPAGAGLLQAQLEQLRQRLEAEGFFDPSRKRPLPAFPTRIGVVTSATGAVWHDIQRVIARRYPLVELILSPATVEGTHAASSVVQALQRLYAYEPDVIIVARGGGSAESLWGFNDEAIVRAVFASPIPIVSAIGHDTDTTLIDFVADVAASTPSVAAELVVPDKDVLLAYLADVRVRASDAAVGAISTRSTALNHAVQRLILRSPMLAIESMRSAVQAADLRARAAVGLQLERRSHLLGRFTSQLEVLNPLAVLARGFAWVTNLGIPVHSASSLSVGETLNVTFADGTVGTSVAIVTLNSEAS